MTWVSMFIYQFRKLLWRQMFWKLSIGGTWVCNCVLPLYRSLILNYVFLITLHYLYDKGTSCHGDLEFCLTTPSIWLPLTVHSTWFHRLSLDINPIPYSWVSEGQCECWHLYKKSKTEPEQWPHTGIKSIWSIFTLTYILHTLDPQLIEYFAIPLSQMTKHREHLKQLWQNQFWKYNIAIMIVA